VGPLDTLTHRLRPARGAPDGALVLLHGRGANELDLLPLLDELDPEQRLFGVAPRGPLTLPPSGHHWYVVARVGYPDPDSFWRSFGLLETWLEKLPEVTGVPLERTVLGGFSMGAVMSYALGLGAGRPTPAGILGLSGFIPTVERFDPDLDARRGLRVATVHGTYDPVISVDFARDARRRLEAAGVDALYREFPGGHSVDPALLDELRRWLGETVAPTAPRE
jgi:phospholipase/carboxylesterase